jgi:hypothetical protein
LPSPITGIIPETAGVGTTSRELTAVASGEDPRRRISTYLVGVGTAMSRCLAAFYADMVAYAPTAAKCGKHSLELV